MTDDEARDIVSRSPAMKQILTDIAGAIIESRDARLEAIALENKRLRGDLADTAMRLSHCERHLADCRKAHGESVGVIDDLRATRATQEEAAVRFGYECAVESLAPEALHPGQDEAVAEWRSRQPVTSEGPTVTGGDGCPDTAQCDVPLTRTNKVL